MILLLVHRRSRSFRSRVSESTATDFKTNPVETENYRKSISEVHSVELLCHQLIRTSTRLRASVRQGSCTLTSRYEMAILLWKHDNHRQRHPNQSQQLFDVVLDVACACVRKTKYGRCVWATLKVEIQMPCSKSHLSKIHRHRHKPCDPMMR